MGKMFAHCRPPIWRVDDISNCVQREYVIGCPSSKKESKFPIDWRADYVKQLSESPFSSTSNWHLIATSTITSSPAKCKIKAPCRLQISSQWFDYGQRALRGRERPPSCPNTKRGDQRRPGGRGGGGPVNGWRAVDIDKNNHQRVGGRGR